MKIINFEETPSLINHYVAELRSVDRQTDRMRFRRNLERIGEIMAYEISKTLTYDKVDVTTPLGVATCRNIADKVVLATIFRAGVPFHHGFLSYFDDAENAFVSAYRKYREKDNFDVFIEYIALLTKGNPARLHVASVIASRQAIEYVERTFPADTTLWVATIDDEINAHSYIVPGLGDAGDLAYGVKE